MINRAPRFPSVVDPQVGPITLLPGSFRELQPDLAVCVGVTPDGILEDVVAHRLRWPDGRLVVWVRGPGGWEVT